jgi:hypothetical protein
VKYAKNGAGRTSLRLFPQPVTEKEAAMAFWVLAWQKTSSLQTCLVF